MARAHVIGQRARQARLVRALLTVMLLYRRSCCCWLCAIRIVDRGEINVEIAVFVLQTKGDKYNENYGWTWIVKLSRFAEYMTNFIIFKNDLKDLIWKKNAIIWNTIYNTKKTLIYNPAFMWYLNRTLFFSVTSQRWHLNLTYLIYQWNLDISYFLFLWKFEES